MSHPLLVQAVRTLASYDADHAAVLNGVGYSKADTWFGESLARLAPDDWTEQLTWEAWDMLAKYRGQLLSHGIDWFEIPTPPKVTSAVSRRDLLEPLLPEYKEVMDRREREEQRKDREQQLKYEQFLASQARRVCYAQATKYNGEVFVLVLGRNRPPDLMNAVRGLPDRRWGDARPDLGWEAPMTPANALHILAILNQYGYEVTDELLDGGRFSVDTDCMQYIDNLAARAQEQSQLPPCRVMIEKQGTMIAPCIVTVYPRNHPSFLDIKSAVKAVPGARWGAERDDKGWELPITSDTLNAVLKLAEDYDFTIDESFRQLQQRMETEKAERLVLSRAQNAEIQIPPGFGTGDLQARPFQKAFVAFCKRALKPNKGVLNGDSMGLGKTLEALLTAHCQDLFPLLVVCPASLKRNWQREIAMWLPGRSVVTLSGREGGPLPEADLTIINYDVLGYPARDEHNKIIKHGRDYEWRGWLPHLQARGFTFIVFDECHYIKEARSQRAKALEQLAKTIPYRLGLSGTPFLNNLSEGMHAFRVLGRIEDMGGWFHVMKRYCGAYRDGWGSWRTDPNRADPEGLNELLRSLFYMRRTKEEVLTELPSKTRVMVPMSLDNWPVYNKIADDLLAHVEKKALADEDFAASLAHLPREEQIALRRAHANDKVEKAERAHTLVLIEELRQACFEGKLKEAIEWIDGIVNGEGQKLVVFVIHRKAAKAIAKHFNAPMIIGGVSDQAKDDAVQAMQNDPNCKLVVCNIRSGGVGLTMTGANLVGFLEIDWNNENLKQAEDRVHRLGQDRPVTVYYLTAEGTIDTDMWAIIESKRKLVDAATEGEAGEIEGRALDEIIRGLRERHGKGGQKEAA